MIAMHMDKRQAIAWRAAQDLPKTGIVNLGRGLPTDVANFVPADCAVMLHSENGLLGVGPAPSPDAMDSSITNASKSPVTLVPGASIFDLVESFEMIRGGRTEERRVVKQCVSTCSCRCAPYYEKKKKLNKQKKEN